MHKALFGATALLALSATLTVLPTVAQEKAAEEKQKTPEQLDAEAKAKEAEAKAIKAAHEAKKKKLEEERKRVAEFLPERDRDVGFDEDLELPLGKPRKNDYVRKPISQLIADMIIPYDKCQKNPTSTEINDAYKKAYEDLLKRIDHLRKATGQDLDEATKKGLNAKEQEQAKERVRAATKDEELKRMAEELKRLEDFKAAMPKPGQCYGYHGR